MKKAIYIASVIALLSVGAAVYAANVSLSMTQGAATVVPGKALTSSVVIKTAGDKVCTVKGTIVFNNVTCQNIVVSNGLVVQTTPTCASPNFTIGIPKCAISDTAVIAVLGKAGTKGSASIALANVNIIGVGVSIGTASSPATYTVASPAVVPTTPVVKPVVTPSTSDNSGSSTTTVPTQDENNNVTVTPNTGDTTANQPAGFLDAPFVQSALAWIKDNVIWDIIILAVLAYIVYLLVRANTKKGTTPKKGSK